ncbi:AAA family ATPase [Martelella radicis]|uniref:Wobble nucleotide-excising tRNase n=1 Tax=Martelella radicis TaxID=1397476 RepID=A0A7W6KND7_9HYPH|nr:AAA family ATPase [Martelella radicis]MBB4124335.1 wobble nucleotide-excising tRNase [Martelella radicis]
MKSDTNNDACLSVRVKHIGPVMELEGKLSPKGQNLLFATSGTGKSFISRALRALDGPLGEGEKDIDPADVVSEESSDGALSLLEGTAEIARIAFDKTSGLISRFPSQYIFHVFSSDYVGAELASRSYELDGDIDHQIILGKENLELQDKEAELEKIVGDLDEAVLALSEAFQRGKDKLRKALSIRANLQDFSGLDLEKCRGTGKRPEKLPTSAVILEQFNALKAVPSDPEKPNLLAAMSVQLNVDEIRSLLERRIDQSTIAAEVKAKIEADREFFEKGVQLLKNDEECPFCTQKFDLDARSVIDAYLAYFADAEAKTRTSIRRMKGQTTAIRDELLRREANLNQAIIRYDALKVAFPSLSSTSLQDDAEPREKMFRLLDEVDGLLEEKAADITRSIWLRDDFSIEGLQARINEVRETNRTHIEKLNSTVDNSTSERLALQRRGCSAFNHDFREENKAAIDELAAKEVQRAALSDAIEALKKTSGDKVEAREKVADTLEELISFAFHGRYSFDRENFSVKRDQKNMVRGSDRTLSDGEKTVLAFCYFVAQSHLKIYEVGDYRKLYLIVDDPVSSVSFDYVYCICQILKTLRIDGGDIRINTNGSERPKLLILTHHDFFYNVVLNNNVVQKNALFQLVSRGHKHEIVNQKNFVAPHIFHLQHIIDVATSRASPNPATPNAVRSVLEGIWRFAYPQKADLQAFLNEANSQHAFQVRSVLIQDMSHGGKMWTESPLSADIETACKEAIEILRYYAPGQVESVGRFEGVLNPVNKAS